MLLVTLPTALAIASIHIFSRLLGWLDGIPRARLLSAAGGISVSFVVVRLLPGLGEPKYPPVKAIAFHTRSTSKFYGDDYAVEASDI